MEIINKEYYRSGVKVNLPDDNVRVTLTMKKWELKHLEKFVADPPDKTGFSYVNIVSSAKECAGWLNLFFGEYCIALVRDVEFADMLRKDLPEKEKHTI